jgi:hypothetical protein
MSRIQLTTSQKFTNYKKTQASKFLNNFKFKGETLQKLEEISNKGYYIDGGYIWTIHPYGDRKKDLNFIVL